jgi:hypothetical protein
LCIPPKDADGTEKLCRIMQNRNLCVLLQISIFRFENFDFFASF